MAKKDLSRQISAILQECCPAFVRKRDSESGSEWHYCHCNAQNMDPCDCVWQITDTCIAGTWPQLAFLKKLKKQQEEQLAMFLEQAKRACKG
jgi:hypothetical protein